MDGVVFCCFGRCRAGSAELTPPDIREGQALLVGLQFGGNRESSHAASGNTPPGKAASPISLIILANRGLADVVYVTGRVTVREARRLGGRVVTRSTVYGANGSSAASLPGAAVDARTITWTSPEAINYRSKNSIE